MNEETGLTLSELLSLDALIAIAQQRGLSLDDQVKSTEEQTEAVAEVHEAMWEARHGGLELSERDRVIIAQIRELALQLEIAPTLSQLIELRGQALQQSRR